MPELKVITTISGTLFLLFTLVGKAQQNNQDPKLKSDKRSFHYTYDNDLFAGSDRYYTQGSIVEIRHPALRKWPLSKLLHKIAPGNNMVYCLSFRQDVFTPKSIRNKVLDSTDRPYAGTFFFSQKVISQWFWSKLTASVDIGCIGPAALGEEMQKFIHKHTNNAEPIGWENQVANSFAANFNVWFEQGLYESKWFDLIGEAGGKAGVTNVNGSVGLMIRAGRKQEYFPGLNKSPNSKWECYTTFNGTATYVYHNAVLQGVPWKNSTYVLARDKIERFVYRLDAGLTFSLKNISLTYTQSFLTPEFKGGWHHSWGGCNIVYRF